MVSVSPGIFSARIGLGRFTGLVLGNIFQRGRPGYDLIDFCILCERVFRVQ